jgi:hypothetical protein
MATETIGIGPREEGGGLEDSSRWVALVDVLTSIFTDLPQEGSLILLGHG